MTTNDLPARLRSLLNMSETRYVVLLTNEQQTHGHPRKWERWQIVNAILYVTRTGCQRRMWPKDLPPWQTVYGYFRRWTRQGLWERLKAALVERVSTRAGRHPQPSAAVMDSQNVKTSEGDEARGVAWRLTTVSCLPG